MKKKILLPVMALALTFASCDMDKEPYNQIPASDALETPTDFSNMRNNLYASLRITLGGTSFVNAPDIQADEFNAMAGYLGTFGYLYNWSFASNMSEANTVYSNNEFVISYANFLIDGYNDCDMSNPNLFTPDALAEVSNIKGEAYFMRAFALYNLAQYFCAAYDETTADAEHSGVSYRLDIYPSSNVSSYPARNTLRQTYAQIVEDLDSAAKYVTTAPARDSRYITTDGVKALQARVALAMGNYQTAAQKAVEVINSNIYRFANSVSALTTMWEHNSNANTDPESIFKLSVTSIDDIVGQVGQIYGASISTRSDYMPTQDVLDLFDDNDYRKQVYFSLVNVQTNTGASGEVYLFTKYPYEGYIYRLAQSEYARYQVMPKVFRLSEMYLIAAEAYAMMGDYNTGGGYLNTEKNNRISGYSFETFNGQNDLMAAIREERQREFLGEGMRLFDLKRWHMGVNRGTPQNEDLCNQPGNSNTTELNRSADDFRMVWPIPQDEINANPNITQNPGY